MRGMQERVEGLGGHYDVDGGPGRGTCVRIIIPVGEPRNAAAEAGQMSGGKA
jgi:signal transduction histidine kinase